MAILTFDGEINFVTIGASIMDQSFSSKSTVRSAFASAGLYVNPCDEAISGNTLSNTLSVLPSILAKYAGQESNTLFFMHNGGNNVSNGDSEATVGSQWRSIIEQVQAAGFDIVASPITYRIPPASNPTDPYNVNQINPIIADLMPDWYDSGTSTSLIDLYSLTFDNQGTWHEGDGIHPSAAGEAQTRDYIAGILAANITQTNATTNGIEHAVFDVSSSGSYTVYNRLWAACNTIYNNNGLLSTGRLTTSGVSVFDSFGRGNAGDSSISLENHYLLLDGAYTQGGTITIGFDTGTVLPASLYTVKVTSSRATTSSTRKADITIGGVTNTQDATSNPPEIDEWTDVLGQDLLDNGISIATAAGSSYAYVNGVEVIKQEETPTVEPIFSDLSVNPIIDTIAFQLIAAPAFSDLSTQPSIDSIIFEKISTPVFSGLSVQPSVDSINFGSVIEPDFTSLIVNPSVDVISFSSVVSPQFAELITQPTIDTIGFEVFASPSFSGIAVQPTIDKCQFYTKQMPELTSVLLVDTSINYKLR